MFVSRSVRHAFTAVAALALAGGGVMAQLESGDRGIPPIDSSNTLEIGGIKVDVTAKDPESARFAGWRMAQRQGFKALWAKTHNLPIDQAPNLPDSTLDSLVSSIIVQSEQIGPTRYMATLGIAFDRVRSGNLLGVSGPVRNSAPLLLIPVIVTGGTMTSVELRNSWQRAWAEFRTSASPVDYVRVSGLGIDPLLINAAQTRRPGRDWWRNLIDQYGAADVLVAEVQLRHFYPGGPVAATFMARSGPDSRPLGSVTLRAANSAELPEVMELGVQKLDGLFRQALAAGLLTPDPSLIVPEPPPPPEEEEDEVADTTATAQAAARVIQIVVEGPLSPANMLRGFGGVRSVTEIGRAVIVVTYSGSQSALQTALASRGWTVSSDVGGLRVSGAPTPAAPVPAPAPAPAPVSPAPPPPRPGTP